MQEMASAATSRPSNSAGSRIATAASTISSDNETLMAVCLCPVRLKTLKPSFVILFFSLRYFLFTPKPQVSLALLFNRRWKERCSIVRLNFLYWSMKVVGFARVNLKDISLLINYIIQ